MQPEILRMLPGTLYQGSAERKSLTKTIPILTSNYAKRRIVYAENWIKKGVILILSCHISWRVYPSYPSDVHLLLPHSMKDAHPLSLHVMKDAHPLTLHVMKHGFLHNLTFPNLVKNEPNPLVLTYQPVFHM